MRTSIPLTLETSVRSVGPFGQPVLGAAVMKAAEIYDNGWDVMGASDLAGRFVLRLAESTAAWMRFAPLYGSKTGAYEQVRDVDGKLDRSFEV